MDFENMNVRELKKVEKKMNKVILELIDLGLIDLSGDVDDVRVDVVSLIEEKSSK